MSDWSRIKEIAEGGIEKSAAELNIAALLSLSANIKALHVHTKRYAQHKALDDAFEALNDTVDEFNECVQGYYLRKTGRRLPLSNPEIKFTLPGDDDKVFDAVKQLEGKFTRAASRVTDGASALLSLKDDVLNCFYKLYYLLDLK